MKKYVLNKNVEHNGKPYPKGVEIKEGDPGFKAIVDAGHADVLDFSDKAEVDEKPKQVFSKKGKA